MIGYNRLCNLEDFADPSLRTIIREVFQHELDAFPPDYPDGVADSKQWEIAMAIRGLRDHGALTPQARLLGVGAGTEITSFFLTRYANEVVATDIYANSEAWADVAPAAFLANPAAFSVIPYDTRRLVPLHMDGRVLDFPDNSFDGVFSSGSIEHFGSRESVSNAAYEIGRVLKPGGIAAIATEFKLGGAPGDGWDPNVILFTADTLRKYIVEASGLEPVDQPEFEMSDATLATRRDLVGFLAGASAVSSPAEKIGIYPNLILFHEGYVFCSVHVTLRKPAIYPAKDNAWAVPTEDMRRAVRAAREAAATHLATTSAVGNDLLQLLRGPSDPDPDIELQNLEIQLQIQVLEAKLAAIRNSRSWRMTAPVRGFGMVARLLRRALFLHRI
jgi:SAM-dependent methyltransferase